MDTEAQEEVRKKFHDAWDMEQLRLKQQLVMTDSFDFTLDVKDDQDIPLRYIGGVDISFVGNQQADGTEDACAALVVLSYPELKIVYSKYEMVKLTLPYIPGYLAFREAPGLLPLIEELRTTQPHLLPQVIMVDGNGVLHPRGFGLASQLGVLSGIPTIGIGKKLLLYDGLTRESVGALSTENLLQFGDHAELKGDSGTVHGLVFRSTKAKGPSSKHIHISIGHRISLQTALRITREVCLVKIPEPVRAADLGSREFLRQLRRNQKEKEAQQQHDQKEAQQQDSGLTDSLAAIAIVN